MFPKIFFKLLETQNMKNQIIFELYTDDNKSKYSSNPMNILKSTKSELPQLLLLNLFGKFLTERKYLMNTLNHKIETCKITWKAETTSDSP